MSAYVPQPFPPPTDSVETRAVLRRLPSARAALAAFNAVQLTIPNRDILIQTLILQEAKQSSEIENIITTHDELYRSALSLEGILNPATKEVQNYARALNKGYELVQQYRFLSVNHIIELHEIIEENKAGLHSVPGTAPKNAATQEVVYTPPQDPAMIRDLMDDLARYFNDDTDDGIDP